MSAELTAADRNHLYAHMGRCAAILRDAIPEGQVDVRVASWGDIIGDVVQADVTVRRGRKHSCGSTWGVQMFMHEPEECFRILAHQCRVHFDRVAALSSDGDAS